MLNIYIGVLIVLHGRRSDLDLAATDRGAGCVRPRLLLLQLPGRCSWAAADFTEETVTRSSG